MTDFGPDLNLKTAYSIAPVRATLPAVLSDFKQLYIAETEKFAHITYFINGGFPESVGGEDRIMVKSPDVRSYAEKPEMSAMEITKIVKKNIENEAYNFIAINYANADMVGHTGDFKATKRAAETIDKNLKNLYQSIKEKKGTMIITADHGNADIMWDEKTKQPFTFHTKNPVPFIIASEDIKIKKLKLKNGGKLANIAPTILKILDIYQPEEMAEKPLF